MRVRHLCLALFLAVLPGLAQAGGLAATRTLPAGTILSPSDVGMSDAIQTGLGDPSEAIGLQARITIFEGRPVLASSLRPALLVERNQMVRLTFQRGSLVIAAEGRALMAGSAGDTIRIMNASSRATVLARVNPDGTVTVSN